MIARMAWCSFPSRPLVSGEVMRVPHPIPYQGSKRNLASAILSHIPAKVAALIEPFAGSAAVTLAAAARGLAERYVINHILRPGFITTQDLKARTLRLQKNIPSYVKEIVEQHLKSNPGVQPLANTFSSLMRVCAQDKNQNFGTGT